MPLALRWSVLSLLALLGVAGLIELPLAPPLLSRTGAGTDRVLADLASQESSQDTRERASLVLSRFVGAELTRYFWGGFSGYLDVLGLEVPDDFEPRLSEAPDAVQLLLVPREGGERYLAGVQAQDGSVRGAACRGRGEPGLLKRSGDQLRCPPGWEPLALAKGDQRL